MKDDDLGAVSATEGVAVPCLVLTPEQIASGRRLVPLAEAKRRIGRKKYIHTFMSNSFALIGADHERDGLIEKMRAKGVEEAGAQASALGHTLVIADYVDGAPLFIEAKPRTATKARDAKRAVTAVGAQRKKRKVASR